MLKKISTVLFLLFLFMVQPIMPINIAHASTMQDVSFGTTITGDITETNDQNVYKIVLPKAGKVDLSMISKITEVYVDLKDADGNKVLYSYPYGGSEVNPKVWSDYVNLEAGTYYLNVEQYSSHIGKYSIKVDFTAANNNDVEPNNGTSIAQELKLNSTAITGYISWNDDIDTYKIVLPKAGKVSLNMISKIKEVYVDLRDVDGNRVLNSYPYGGSEVNPKVWSDYADLEAGTYYLNVEKYSSYTGKYSIKVGFAAANNNDAEPNNGTSIAQALKLNSNAITGYISWNDDQDTYKIVIPKAGKVNLSMNSKIKEVYVDLKDADGNRVLNSYPYGGSEANPKVWSDYVDLEAGTYYLNVEKYSSYTGRYSIKADFTAANSKDVEPNNGTSIAQELKINSSATTGYISWNDEQDTYKIALSKEGKVNLNMVSKIKEVYVDLKDVDGNRVLYDYPYGGSEANPKEWSDSVELKAGTYYLNVEKYGSYTGKYSIRVTASGQPVPAASVALNKTILNLTVGNSSKLTAKVSPTNTTNKSVKWISSDTKVATVDANGKITAIGTGSAIITCTTKDGSKKSATCKVTVKNPIKVTKIKLNKTSLSLVKGNTSKLTATLEPTNATNKSVTWSSSNPKVAIVDANGKITAVGTGNAIIKCTTKDGSKKSVTCKVTVTK